jgi:hypothetical protein
MSAVLSFPADPREHCAPPASNSIKPTIERNTVAHYLMKTSAAETLDDMCNESAFTDAVDIALARGDARLIGQLVIAARGDLARRRAMHALYEEDVAGAPKIEQIVTDVFLAATTARMKREVMA